MAAFNELVRLAFFWGKTAGEERCCMGAVRALSRLASKNPGLMEHTVLPLAETSVGRTAGGDL